MDARSTNLTIARIAGRQFGVVARRQLREAGISDKAIWSRRRSGLLRRIHHGVFAITGAQITEPGYWMAAVLANGRSAVLSHTTAAKAWGILDRTGPIQISRLSSSRHTPHGIEVFRPRSLPEEDLARKGPLPLTAVPRTLLDLAALSDPRLLEDAFSASRRLGLMNAAACRRCVGRGQTAKGRRRLLDLLDQFEPIVRPSLSELQDRVLRLCLDAGLPAPEPEVRIGHRIVDFLWRDEKVILEVDGYAYHRDLFDADRDRDLDHLALGYRTIRVTYYMIETNPKGVVRRIEAVLNQ